MSDILAEWCRLKIRQPFRKLPRREVKFIRMLNSKSKAQAKRKRPFFILLES